MTHLVTFWDLYFPCLRSQTLELQCRHPPEAGELATGKSAQNLLVSLLLFHQLDEFSEYLVLLGTRKDTNVLKLLRKYAPENCRGS